MAKYLGKLYITKYFQHVNIHGETIYGRIYKSKLTNDYGIALDDGTMLRCYYSKVAKKYVEISSTRYASRDIACMSARNYVIRKARRKYDETSVL